MKKGSLHRLSKILVIAVLFLFFGNLNVYSGGDLLDANFQWRNDDGSEADATWKAGLNVPITTVDTVENIRLRYELDNSGIDADALITNLALQYCTVSNGTYDTIGVVETNKPFVLTSTIYYSNGEATSNQLNPITATFVPGNCVSTPGNINTITIDSLWFTEYEFCFEATRYAIPGQTYFFSTKNYDAQDVNSAIRYASLTIRTSSGDPDGHDNPSPADTFHLEVSSSTGAIVNFNDLNLAGPMNFDRYDNVPPAPPLTLDPPVAEFSGLATNDYGIEITVNALADKYWSISEGTTLFDGTFSISLPIAGLTGIEDFQQAVIVKRNNEHSSWIPQNTVLVDGTHLKASGLTDFSEFGVGIGPCQQPVNPTATTMSSSSVQVGWTEVGSAEIWDIEWGTTGFTQGSGTMVTGLTSNAYLIESLTYGDDYDWYVRSDCGSGITSDWLGPNAFRVAFNLAWTGNSSNDWNTEGNWNPNSIPTTNYNVVIPNSLSNYPVIGTGATADCYSLSLASTASLTVNSGGSLITEGTITNEGTIDIKRDITQGAWHMISEPNNVTTANLFLGNYLQGWDETTGLWSDISEPATALTPVTGYGLWANGTGTGSYTFSGTPNTGDLSTATTFTEYSTEPEAAEGANLLGNPYPSSIDWSGLYGTYGAVNYWNGTAYVSWNDGVGSGSQYVPPMQGFFIVTSVSGTFDLTNNNRTHSGATSYYKSSESISNGLVLEASNGSYNDALYILFNEQSNEGFDLQYDAYKFLSNTQGLSQIYSFSNDKMLSIDVRPDCEIIRLGFQNDQAGIYSIRINEMADISTSILEDTKENIFHDLSLGAYDFTWVPADNEKRFKLHLSAVGIEEAKISKSNIFIYAAENQIFVKGAESGKVLVSDILGRIVVQKDISPDSYRGGFISIPINLKTGVYVVMVIPVAIGSEGVKTEKVFIK
nr:hypothetical protein [Bacteroidota bacterium]